MSKKYNTEIKTSVSGNSESIVLDNGIWNIFVTAPSWSGGTCSIEVSPDNVTFLPAKKESGDALVFTENDVEQINGGVILRVNNDTNISNFYLVAKKVL